MPCSSKRWVVHALSEQGSVVLATLLLLLLLFQGWKDGAGMCFSIPLCEPS